MALLYLALMTACIIVGIPLLVTKQGKMKRVAVIILLLGSLFMVLGIKAADAASYADDSSLADDTQDDDSDDVDDEFVDDSDADAQSESIASSESAESESIAESESVASRESAASASSASQAEADRIAASESQAASASVEATHQAGAYSDPRPAQAPNTPHYDYAPVPDTAQSETVYVSAAIPGRYHKDPNCRGLQRYGGAQAMTLAQAQAKGYQAFCAYERYE